MTPFGDGDGPKLEIEEIKSKVQVFLRNKLKLEVSEHKTLIPTRLRIFSVTTPGPSWPMTKSLGTAAGNSTVESTRSCPDRRSRSDALST